MTCGARLRTVLSVMAVIFCCSVADAGYKDDIRYNMLANELGENLPDGATVKVFQVEARIDSTGAPNFVPDVDHSEFVGKTIIASPATGETSDHATGVARHFYGSSKSIAQGISSIDVYWSEFFLGSGFLRNESLNAPVKSDGRVFIHSWVGTASISDLDILHRLDFVVETYDQIQVVGVNNAFDGGNPSQPLLASGYNPISVGMTSGEHAYGSTDVSGGLYSSGRTKPDLVAPLGFTSQAAPVVAAASVLLLETGHNNPELSNGSYSVETDIGTYTVQHAEASEVIKAALMAGAQRVDIPAYSVGTANGLDEKWGAGELDVYNSYHIIADGEQDSTEQLGYVSQLTGHGFDYDPSFALDDTATYRFVPGVDSTSISVTLAWNIDIAGGTSEFDGTATLVDFDLLFYEIGPSENTLLAASESRMENTENVWLTGLTPGTEYLLEVVRSDDLEDLDWDYGLAWNVADDDTIPLYGDMNGDGSVDIFDIDPFILALTNRGAYDATYAGLNADRYGDINGDGSFNHLDIDSMAALLGGESLESVGLDGISPNVPEPTTFGLLALGAMLALLPVPYRRWESCGK